MRLILTRAAEDAARTRQKLEAMGHEVIVSPVIEIVGTGASWPTGVVDAVIATSAQAFAVSCAEGPVPEARRLMPLYLVGQRTTEAAREAGFLGAATVASNAAFLASLWGDLSYRPSRPVYLAGRDRKPDLETALRAMGQRFDVVEIYEARPLQQPSAEAGKALAAQAIGGVLHFSRRSAALFVAATQKAGLDIGRPMHFCLSADVAVPLKEAGCPRIAVAAEPNEADLLSLIGPG